MMLEPTTGPFHVSYADLQLEHDGSVMSEEDKVLFLEESPLLARFKCAELNGKRRTPLVRIFYPTDGSPKAL